MVFRDTILDHFADDVANLAFCGGAIVYGAFYFLLSIFTMLYCGCFDPWGLVVMSLPLVIMAVGVIPILLRFRFIGFRVEDVFRIYRVLYDVFGDIFLFPILFAGVGIGGVYYLMWLGVAMSCGCLNNIFAVIVALPLLFAAGYLTYLSFKYPAEL